MQTKARTKMHREIERDTDRQRRTDRNRQLRRYTARDTGGLRDRNKQIKRQRETRDYRALTVRSG